MILRPGEARVSVRPADHESSRRVDVVHGLCVQELGGNGLADHRFDECFLQLLVRDLFGVLVGKDDRCHVGRLAVDVLHRHLAFAVGAEEIERPVFACLCRRLHDLVCEADRRRHQARGLGAGIAEHHALVSRAHLVVQSRAVDALRDVGRLPLDGGDDRAGFVVDAVGGFRVPDALQHAAHDRGKVDVPVGGDFSAHHHEARGGEALAGDVALRVLLQRLVQHGIRYLVADLVGMSFPNAFRSEDEVFSLAHKHPPKRKRCLKNSGGLLQSILVF